MHMALANIRYFTKAGVDNGAEGMIVSQWGDYGAETFRELNLFPYAWSAQCAWNYKTSDVTDFSREFSRDFFGLRDARKLNGVYQTLSSVYGDLLWHDVWQYPALK